MKRTIFTSQSDFKLLRTGGGVYVDKTKQLYDCLTTDKYFFIARPRRFGKSILCSTLRELFLANRSLFKDLWIDSSDWQWEAHPVIHLSMATLARTFAGETKLARLLCKFLQNQATKFGVTLDPDLSPGAELDPADLLSDLLAGIHKKYDKTVVVIIDEYDKPILDLFNSRRDHTGVHALLKSFYGQLKHQEEHLRFVFITGIYKFTKTSIFSDLNNLRDLTFDPGASDLVGYTQTELEANFPTEIDRLTLETGGTRTQLLENLKTRYNGYVFGMNQSNGNLSSTVYNSYVINMIFATNELKKTIWFSSGTPTFLLTQLEQRSFIPLNVDQLETMANTLTDSCSPEKLTIETLLYFAGYVTIKNYDPKREIIQLKYPNQEIASAMAREILPRMSSFSDLQWQKTAFELREALLAADFGQVKEIINIALGGLHHKLFTDKESFYQTVLLFMLQQGGFPVDVELPTNRGYIDLVVHGPQTIFIIELKLNRSAGQGLAQIKEKKYFQGLLAAKLPIYLVGINCDSDTRSVTGIVSEKLVL